MVQEYKLQGVTWLDLQNGEKKEVDVEGIEGAKVLLAKVDDKIHALSSKCTHFGAPLKLGVLTPDGRLTCAWHGACFNVETGDVEDAPALDPLAKFEVVEKKDGVYINGDEATIKANRRSANLKCSLEGTENGSGTIGLLQSLRENGYKRHIVVFHKEPYLPIDRTKLSKALIPDSSKLLLRPQEWFDSARISTVHDEVSSVDFDAKFISTKSGRKYHYGKLVLASGGTPRWLPLPGFKELGNIFVLRTVPDVKNIISAVGEKKGKKIIVIGSSFIGMEVANALASDNAVTVVGMEKTPLERVMGEKVGQILQRNLEKNGVSFQMEAGVEKATPSSSDKSVVGAVHLKDGTVLEADLVVLGVGVTPATEYLKDTKIQLEKDGSLKVNESFEVEGHQDVYAIGDIATYPYHGPGGNGNHVRIEHWNVAQNAGRSVGCHIASPKAKPKPFIPVFWSAQGQQLRYCGNTINGWDELVLKGEPENAKFTAYYCKGETVVAVASMQMDPVMAKSAELMRRGKMPSKSELKDGVNPLDLELPKAIKI